MHSPQKGRVTLKEIAEICHCSSNTVSRALRNDGYMAEGTRKRILAVAKQLGYVRNSAATTLRLGTSKMVAVIVNDIRNPYYTNMVIDIDKRLAENGYSMSLLCTHVDEALAGQMIRQAISQAYDGILFSPLNNPDHIHLLESSGIPFVMLDCWVDGVTADVASINDQEGGYLVTKHLLDLGHRNIAYFAGPNVNSSQRERFAGIQRALSEAEIPVTDLHIIPWERMRMNPSPEAIVELVQTLGCTAIIAFNDVLGYHCLNALTAAGYSIPRDVSLVGFDAIRRHNQYLPPLTSLSFKDDKTADVAVDMLLRRMQQPAYPYEHAMLPVAIVDGGTTGPAPELH